MNNLDVEKIYRDAYLYMDEENKDKTIKKFMEVIEDADKLLEIDLGEGDVFELTSDIKSPLREDVPCQSIDRELAFENTDNRKYGYFKLNKVLE